MTDQTDMKSKSGPSTSPTEGLGGTVEITGAVIGESLTGNTGDDGQAKRQLRDPQPPDAAGWWWAIGRRKTAVARVRLRPAKDGDAGVSIQISRKQFKTIEDYFSEDLHRNDAVASLKVNNLLGELKVIARMDGGGIMGQSQALRLGIARALIAYDPTTEEVLREHGFLTRDARKVERKKYGQPGARRRYQFSKR